MQEIREIRFNRAIIPIDAANADVETIDTADASNHLICCAMEVFPVNLFFLDPKLFLTVLRCRELS